MNKFFLLISGLTLISPTLSYGQVKAPYRNSGLDVELRINDLLKRMTLREKILQLNQYTLGENKNVNNIEKEAVSVNPQIGSLIFLDADPQIRNDIQRKAMENTRLGIPILFAYDVIHGYKTIYPIPLAAACSWNSGLYGEACRFAAKETKLSGIDWTFSPMIDIGRDPRWGRVAEGYGEDPYANAVFGASAVHSYQGKKLSDPYSIAACLKHYVGYGVSEGGRDYRYSDISDQALWETYLFPYQAGVKAGAATVMSAFNDISGMPATSNYYTLTTVLKNYWKHDGFVVSDWDAVGQLVFQGVAKNRSEAGEKALMAGVDMDMRDNIYLENLEKLLKEGKVSQNRINDAVKRILRVKFRLGLFDKPYTPILPESDRYQQPESIRTGKNLAEESMVLLKNTGGILPINPMIKNIAVIGPLAKDSVDLLGSWNAQGSSTGVMSIQDAIKKEFISAQVKYAKGCDFENEDISGFGEAIEVAKKSDLVILCLGEKRTWSGENASRSTIALPIIQSQLANALKSTGKKIILVLSNGRPLELKGLEPISDAILEAWQPGTSGGEAVAGILSGRINPSGKLAITFPLSSGQIPIYYNMRQPARPELGMGDYQDIPTKPLYNFGYGLSYSALIYSTLQLSSNKIKRSGELTATVEVSNSSDRDAKEAVFWFISDPVASVSRPVKELKFFEKKVIKAGQKTIYKFTIVPSRDLSFPDGTGQERLENGDFFLQVGDQKVKFELTD